MRAWVLAIAFGLLTGHSGSATAAEIPEAGLTVVVYRTSSPGGLAVVSDRRRIDLVAGDNEVRFEGVAGQLDPGSVLVRDLGDPATRVLEQSFRWDMASPDALLARYLGEPVILVTTGGEKRGRLRAFDATQIVLSSDDPGAPAQIVARGKDLVDIRFAAAPGSGLAARPTLVFRVVAERAGPHLLEASYQTTGLSWNADYAVVVGAGGQEKKVELSGWLGVQNKSDGDFPAARWLVVAGDVLRATDKTPSVDPYTGVAIAPPALPASSARRYELAGRAGLAHGQTRQFELVPQRRDLPGKLVLVHEHVPAFAHAYRQQGYPTFDQSVDGTGTKKIEQLGEYLELAVPAGADGLPGGRLRVHRLDERTGAPALVAEEAVDHSSGVLRVRVGGTADVSGERKQADYRLDERARDLREKFEIRLRNSRGSAIEVRVVEHLFRWRTWSIEGESAPYERSEDGGKAIFRVKIPAKGEVTLSYTARYSSW